MNQEIKKQWVDALRSGDYQQCKGKLNDGKGGFCCLGVLSDLYAKAHNLKWIPILSNNPKAQIKGKMTLAVVPMAGEESLANEVRAWADIINDNPWNPAIIFKGQRLSLAEMNDKGYDFKVIESQL